MSGPAGSPPSTGTFGRCPECGGSLEPGFLLSQRGLAWTETYHGFWTADVRDWLVKPWAFRQKEYSLPGQKCMTCGLILVHHP